jgi:murein DD-endopeptidase MepM/ murein hydrolase activator NlpD
MVRLSNVCQEIIVSRKKTRFTEMLIKANGIDPNDFQSWVFCPGMRFNSPDKWWGDRGRRDFPHEGIDFCLYQDLSGRMRRFDHKARVPVMHDGVVRAMFVDYLGVAVIVEHKNAASANETYLSLYAHTTPRQGLHPGVMVNEGDIIATVADTRRSKAKIAPHLHYTIGKPAPVLAYEQFVWNTLRDPGQVTLLDPLGLIDWPCQMLDPQNPCCLEN